MDEPTINLCEPYKLYESNKITVNQFIWEIIQELKYYTKDYSYIKIIINNLKELLKTPGDSYTKGEKLETILEDFYNFCEDKRIEVNSNYFEPDSDYYS